MLASEISKCLMINPWFVISAWIITRSSLIYSIGTGSSQWKMWSQQEKQVIAHMVATLRRVELGGTTSTFLLPGILSCIFFCCQKILYCEQMEKKKKKKKANVLLKGKRNLNGKFLKKNLPGYRADQRITLGELGEGQTLLFLCLDIKMSSR